jgi:hypothetical protein
MHGNIPRCWFHRSVLAEFNECCCRRKSVALTTLEDAATLDATTCIECRVTGTYSGWWWWCELSKMARLICCRVAIGLSPPSIALGTALAIRIGDVCPVCRQSLIHVTFHVATLLTGLLDFALGVDFLQAIRHVL